MCTFLFVFVLLQKMIGCREIVIGLPPTKIKFLDLSKANVLDNLVIFQKNNPKCEFLGFISFFFNSILECWGDRSWQVRDSIHRYFYISSLEVYLSYRIAKINMYLFNCFLIFPVECCPYLDNIYWDLFRLKLVVSRALWHMAREKMQYPQVAFFNYNKTFLPPALWLLTYHPRSNQTVMTHQSLKNLSKSHFYMVSSYCYLLEQ